MEDREISAQGLEDSGEAEFIDRVRVQEAIRTFGAYKAAGPDGFKPIVLQNMGQKALQRLTTLYKASLMLRWVPGIWRRSRAVFIPKPGKDDYTKAKAFRPISLSSFVLKTMERVILWHVEATSLVDSPLSTNQHGFRHNSSCDSAISGLVDRIESAIHRKRFGIGVFLDIQGAFDNLDLDKAVQGMEEHSFPAAVTGWYSHLPPRQGGGDGGKRGESHPDVNKGYSPRWGFISSGLEPGIRQSPEEIR